MDHALPQAAFNQWLARNLQDLMAAFTPVNAPSTSEEN